MDDADTKLFASKVFTKITFMGMVAGSINLYCISNKDEAMENMLKATTVGAVVALILSLLVIVGTHHFKKHTELRPLN